MRDRYAAYPFLLVFLFLFGGFRPQARAQSQGLVPDSTEVRVLRQLYAKTRGSAWLTQTNWLEGTTLDAVATWHGVTVVAGDIWAIHLPNNRLQGPLPASLGLLANLRELDLSYNQLQGALPTSLGQLLRLRTLVLSHNTFTGIIPKVLGTVQSLEQLQLNHNRLEGSLPGSLWSIPYLRRLDVSYNQLKGTVPDSAGGQPVLYVLLLQHNQFTGPLPASLGQVTSLAILDLSENRLSGKLPTAWSTLSNLANLYLSHNQLAGEIPKAWENMRGLQQLSLDHNQLEGSVPAELKRIPTLYGLVLHHNKFTYLPSWAGTSLALLDVRDNYLAFNSIEPNFSATGTSIVPSFSFTPQRILPPDTLQNCLVGSQRSLHRGMKGTGLLYQWERQLGAVWIEVAAPNDSTLQLSPVTASMEGNYRVRVTHPKVTTSYGAAIPLYTRTTYVDVLPYAPLALNEPKDTGCPPLTLLPALVVASRPATSADSVNYVRTYTARAAYTDSTLLAQAPVDSVQISTAYLDGLGRVVQTVIQQESPNKRDIVQPIAYDALGRQEKEYLPYTATPNAVRKEKAGGYRGDALHEQYQFYVAPTGSWPSTQVAYSKKAFEPSPLNRVTAQGSAGEAWNLDALDSHAVVLFERPTTARDTVYRWAPGFGNNHEDLLPRQPYAPGELWSTLTRDEQWHLSQSFTDKQGRVVLKQVAEHITARDTSWLKTYYVYDEFDRLRAVLPPLAVQRIRRNNLQVTGAGVERLLFRYNYDDQGRLIAKRIPDQDGYTYSVYDGLDRPVLTQDVAQRSRSEWVATKYDALGRVAYTALIRRPGSERDMLQAQASQDTTHWENPSATRLLERAYYTNRSYPTLTSGDQLLSIAYYDTYDYNQDGVTDADAAYVPATEQQLGGKVPVADTRVTGLATRSETRVLGTPMASNGAWLTSTSFFDEKQRLIQVVSTNARGGQDVVSSRYDFAGKVRGTYTVHTDPRHEAITVQEKPTYDHAGRVLSTTQALNGGAAVPLAQHTYNEIGQLEKKVLGNALQTVDYRYNIRGWLTQLNNPDQAQTDDLWSMSLHYDCGFTTREYNGNIAGQRWRSKSDNIERAYGYRYDSLNRVLQGDFVAKGLNATTWEAERGNYRFWAASYDANGNLLSLRRRGLLQEATRTTPRQYGVTDNIRYRYAPATLSEPVSNRLLRVDELAPAAAAPAAGQPARPDFQDGATSGSTQADYTYDAAGSLTSDRNKGITAIRYNHLRLPEAIRFATGDSLLYRYTASGQKVAKVAYAVGKPQVQTDYAGAWQYEKDSLRWLNHSEGRLLRFETRNVIGQPVVRYSYEYTLKDHLGNLRVAFREGVIDTDTATLEPVTAARERRLFDAASVSAPVARETSEARTGRFAAVLNAAGTSLHPPTPLGPFKQIAVAKGDAVQVKAYAHYLQPKQQSNWTFTLAGFVAGLLQPAPLSPTTGPDVSGKLKVLPLLNVALNSSIIEALRQFPDGVPQAYVRLLVFNQDSVPIAEVTQQISILAQTEHEVLMIDIPPLEQAGYVQVYVANESDTDVYFDDIEVTHHQGLQVQENHYDPFGLDLVGVSKSATPENKYSWNGKEKQSEFGLNWHDHGWRFYDPALGRWVVSDPDAEEADQESWGTYQFGLDNAVRYNDLDGRQAGPGDEIPTVAGAFVDFSASVANLVLSTWAYATGSSTKLQAQVDNFQVHYETVPVGGVKQEAKSFGLDALNVALNVMPTGKAGAGRMLEDATRRVVATEVATGAKATKLIGPAGDPGAVVTKQIPKGYKAVPAGKNNEGTSFQLSDPKKPNSNPNSTVRVMPGNKNSPHPEQQVPYVKQVKNGQQLDAQGNRLPSGNVGPAHIPRDSFIFR
ncbi:DUF6443 domain-containing protein [Hymenobacter sp. BT635]|uniref:DUF6443 domain-containing protein n=1 Tax=Hymenobacter nitidus TaxID=2880929 RepID=A0ABS8AJ58_9BACT|nr:DUF6443 domain-containing protein [Hymenobacter nitidus]MCB2380468.1 DUF6443 domain-containing protein [Hymenobacter nitidus]